jgi:membrane-bound serine protease (ClpP class)
MFSFIIRLTLYLQKYCQPMRISTLTRNILTVFCLVLCTIQAKQALAQGKTIYKYEIHDEIGPAMNRLTEAAIKEAEAKKADYILIDMDTYGGLVDDADQIRTALLKTKIPTIVFVRNNAASAGALISIACDSIYMRPGSTIGAASVVNQSGELMPEKYQSYMRKKMRATAEETGRRPEIAEGMTDENMEIDSIKPAGKIITFSVAEAIKYGYCNGKVETPEEILPLLKGGPYTIIEHKSTFAESISLFLVKPAVSGILLLLIFAGIYFEFKAPGTLLPIALSLTAAMFYFMPLYLEGLAANWEILIFAVGIILILLEIFVIPGFGITGITGIVLTIMGLTLALVRNINFDFTFVPKGAFALSFFMVCVAMAAPLLFLVAFGQRIFASNTFKHMSVQAELTREAGFSVNTFNPSNLVGTHATAVTDLRPAGKVEIEGERYDVVTDGEFIARNTAVKVVRVQGTYLVVERVG